MNTNRLYIDFHIIQTVPPSCINRDDTGRPKTAYYGGANRARVSSQAWKHAMREYFRDLFQTGYRTKYLKSLILEYVSKLDPDYDLKKAETLLTKMMKSKLNTTKKEWLPLDSSDKAKALFFISHHQAKAFAELLIAGEESLQKYRDAMNEAPAIDMALFGRMVASDTDLNIDAAVQVAHAISTHAVQNEYDYFTAVDDYQQEDHAGAGHLGTKEFNSATLYRFATVNVMELKKQLGDDAAKAVRGFAEAMIRSMPTGSQNSYANDTLPNLIYVTVRTDQPVNFCGAFEKPICCTDGYAEKTITALIAHAAQIYEDYCNAPAFSYIIGTDAVLGAERVNLNALLDALEKAVTDEVG